MSVEPCQLDRLCRFRAAQAMHRRTAPRHAAEEHPDCASTANGPTMAWISASSQRSIDCNRGRQFPDARRHANRDMRTPGFGERRVVAKLFLLRSTVFE